MIWAMIATSQATEAFPPVLATIQKRGLIYASSGLHGWDQQYAYLPTADTTDNSLRVFYAALDGERYGRVGYVDLDPANPSRVLVVSARPVLDLGEPGLFDCDGVSPCAVVHHRGRKLLYYMGWQRAERVPYLLFTGAAEWDGEKFCRLSRAPVLDRTSDEPFTRSAPTVISEGGILRCWYVSATNWTTVHDLLYPEYAIRYAESQDGLRWETFGSACIDTSGDEFGIGRPWVIRDGSMYRMWYSIRSRTAPYRIGYAESRDGLKWERMDSEFCLPRSESGWDSEMICFPCIADVGGKRVMLYNGNRHGSTGFGYAEIE
jgi:hypothetical protein